MLFYIHQNFLEGTKDPYVGHVLGVKMTMPLLAHPLQQTWDDPKAVGIYNIKIL